MQGGRGDERVSKGPWAALQARLCPARDAVRAQGALERVAGTSPSTEHAG